MVIASSSKAMRSRWRLGALARFVQDRVGTGDRTKLYAFYALEFGGGSDDGP